MDLSSADRAITDGIYSCAEVFRRRWRRMAKKELRLLYRIQQWRESPRSGLAPRLLGAFVSDSALGDVTSLVWVAWVASALTYKARVWWVCLGCLIVGFAVQHIGSAPTPAQLNRRIRPLSRTAFYGFPCMPTLFATAVFAQAAGLHGSWWASLVALAAVILVGASRVYAGTLFPHQVVGGGVVGMGALVVMRRMYDMYDIEGFHERHHWLGGVAVILPLVAVAAYMAENNTGPLGGIPKSEFIRVLSEIGKEQVTDTGRDPNEEQRGMPFNTTTGDTDDTGGGGTDTSDLDGALTSATSGDERGGADPCRS